MGPSPSGTSSAAQRHKHRWRRGNEVASVEANHAGARVRGQPGKDIQQARLADAWGSVNVQYRERRLGRVEGGPEELDLGCPPHEPAPAPGRQQVTDRAGRPHLGHVGRIGAEVRDDYHLGGEVPSTGRRSRQSFAGGWASGPDRDAGTTARLLLQKIAALTLARHLRDLGPAQCLSAWSPRLPRIARQAPGPTPCGRLRAPAPPTRRVDRLDVVAYG